VEDRKEGHEIVYRPKESIKECKTGEKGQKADREKRAKKGGGRRGKRNRSFYAFFRSVYYLMSLLPVFHPLFLSSTLLPLCPPLICIIFIRLFLGFFVSFDISCL
jgi:hypothetical protein